MAGGSSVSLPNYCRLPLLLQPFNYYQKQFTTSGGWPVEGDQWRVTSGGWCGLVVKVSCDLNATGLISITDCLMLKKILRWSLHLEHSVPVVTCSGMLSDPLFLNSIPGPVKVGMDFILTWNFGIRTLCNWPHILKKTAIASPLLLLLPWLVIFPDVRSSDRCL
jgi:hypothetical protein